MPQLYLYYSLPLTKQHFKGVISNSTYLYSDENLTEPVGVMQDHCVHDMLDDKFITPFSPIKYLPDHKVKTIHLNPSYDSHKKGFTINYVAHTLEPIEATIIHKQNMPRLQKVSRYITRVTETESFGKLEITIK